jgi:hypothetical protein
VVILEWVGCHGIVLERFSVEVKIDQFSTAGGARHLVSDRADGLPWVLQWDAVL